MLSDSDQEEKTNLTQSEREQIAEILKYQANEIAGFSDEYRRGQRGLYSVDIALFREIERLRRLAERVNPLEPENDEV